MDIDTADKTYEARQLLYRLSQEDIQISVDGPDLVLSVGQYGLKPDLKEKIIQQKQNLIAFLNDDMNQQKVPESIEENQFCNRHIPHKNRDKLICSPDACLFPVTAFFEYQCNLDPAAPAVTFCDHTTDYAALNKRANQIADILLRYGIQPDDRVALFMDRSIDLVASILALFKLGAVYIPIDPDFPKARILYVLEDAQVHAIITQDHLENRIPGTSATVISVDSFNSKEGMNSDQHKFRSITGKHAVNRSAYILYTSGSTGNPKGVEITHGSLANILRQIINELSLKHSDVFLAIANISFDISFFELIAPLMIGAQIVLLENDQCKDARSISNIISSNGISVVQGTPAMWMLLNHYEWKPPDGGIKAISTGEALPKDLANKISSITTQFWNLYGPTEASIWATGKRIQNKSDIENSGSYVSIGRPIKGYKSYILDKYLQPVPIGVPGELYIGGIGLAKGYVNNPALTDKCFIKSPFEDDNGARLYKTGDTVRFLDNQDIEYIQRIDSQVKVNGYRIELGEIESLLKKHMSIKDAVVSTAKVSKSRISLIIAYIVPIKDMPNKTGDSFNKYLSRFLPNYMLPHRYMILDSIPINKNGKVDRKALPKPEALSEHEYIAPRNKIEKTVAGFFCEVLEIEKIGIYDSFFDLGGSSMLAATLLMLINGHYDLDISLNKILSLSPTVRNISSIVKAFID